MGAGMMRRPVRLPFLGRRRRRRPTPQDPAAARALADYHEFAHWVGATDERAQAVLDSVAPASRELTEDDVVRAGDILAVHWQ